MLLPGSACLGTEYWASQVHIRFPSHQTRNFQRKVSNLCPEKQHLDRHMFLWLTLNSDCSQIPQGDWRLPVKASTSTWLPPGEAEGGAWEERRPLTCLLQGNQHGLFNEVSLYEAAEVFVVYGEIGKLEGTDGHFQGVLTAPPTAPIGGDMRPGQGNNAGAGMGDAPRQAFFCNEKQSHLRTYIRPENSPPAW